MCFLIEMVADQNDLLLVVWIVGEHSLDATVWGWLEDVGRPFEVERHDLFAAFGYDFLSRGGIARAACCAGGQDHGRNHEHSNPRDLHSLKTPWVR